MCFTLACFTVMLTSSILLLNLGHWLLQKNFWFTLLYNEIILSLFFQHLVCMIINPFLIKVYSFWKLVVKSDSYQPFFSWEISPFSAPNSLSDTIPADTFKIYVHWWQKYLKGHFQEVVKRKPKNLLWYTEGSSWRCAAAVCSTWALQRHWKSELVLPFLQWNCLKSPF